MSALEFRNTELFGGAITASIPQDFFDASSIRQVPDNQELFLSRNNLSSIVIDLGQRVTGEGIHSDLQAFGFHIEDAADPKDRLCVGPYDTEVLRNLPNVPAYRTKAFTRPKLLSSEGVGSGGKVALDITFMCMLLVRLEEKKTDVLVTVHIPFQGRVNEAEVNAVFTEEEWDFVGGNWREEVECGMQMLQAIWESFSIKDWDLFVDDA